MGDNAAKGADQLKKAEKKLASWQIFGNKYEDAAELLEKARDPWALRQTGGATARHPPKQKQGSRGACKAIDPLR
jgi:hypothetical protein